VHAVPAAVPTIVATNRLADARGSPIEWWANRPMGLPQDWR
jgi:hypothetical protein